MIELVVFKFFGRGVFTGLIDISTSRPVEKEFNSVNF
jgi:hypothetical protein